MVGDFGFPVEDKEFSHSMGGEVLFSLPLEIIGKKCVKSTSILTYSCNS